MASERIYAFTPEAQKIIDKMLLELGWSVEYKRTPTKSIWTFRKHYVRKKDFKDCLYFGSDLDIAVAAKRALENEQKITQEERDVGTH